MKLEQVSELCDAIDALIDEQLAAGEPETGYDFDDPQYPDCPNCYRGWHGLRITERIEAMRRIGQFDPNYRVADDDTPVLCEGSEFIGPRRPTPREKLAAALSTSSTDYQIDYHVLPRPGAPWLIPPWCDPLTAAI